MLSDNALLHLVPLAAGSGPWNDPTSPDNAQFGSKLDTQNVKLAVLRWMFGAVMGLLAALLALGLLDRFAPPVAPAPAAN